VRASLAVRSDKVAGALPVRLTPSAAARVNRGRRFDRAVQEPEPLPVMRGQPEVQVGGRAVLDLAPRPVDLVSPLLRRLVAVGGKPA
jgi:hypothetical protein